MSIHLRYELGRLLRKCGYRITREYRWPEIHGNLLLLGFFLLRSRHHGLIQIVQIGVFDGQIADPLADILRLENVSAVLVEPQTIPYKALVVHYEGNPRISLVNAAVEESDGEVILYVPSSRESPKASLIAWHHRRFGVMAKEVHQR